MTGAPGWTEEKFRALTLHSADIISLLDGQGRLLFNSPATLRINGFTPEELRDRDTFELIHPEDRQRVGEVFAEVLATAGAVRTVEYRYLTKDGRWLWMEAVANNQLENPAVRGVVAISRDVSERKRAEAARLRLEQHLSQVQKLESLSVLAGGVAHDFNNLLAVIAGEASVLELLPLEGEAREAVQNMVRAARSAGELTRQLLSYAGQRSGAFEPTDLRGLVEDLSPLLRGAVRDPARLELELASGVSHVSCDRSAVRQVLMSLVLNAWEALTGPGTVTVRLSEREVTKDDLSGPQLADFQPGRAVVLEVIDTGRGMTPETMQRIFDPFFSTRQTGRGLGLAMVAGIVKSHHAGLGLRSQVGEGSRFSLFFTPSSLRQPEALPTAGAHFEGRVLVVDDDALVVRATARMLSALGFQCETVTDGRAALERFSAEPEAWALVACDVLMPGLSGPETVAALRALRPEVPVLFVSGFTADTTELPADAKTGFLGKPFDLQGVTRALRTLVPQREHPSR